MKVCVHLADGFEEVEAISVIDILRRAEIQVETVSIMGKKEVVGAHHIAVLADSLFETVDYKDVDMIILPGGGPGTKKLGEHLGLQEQILKHAQAGKWIAAICAAPTVLGKLGLLAGKKATCYPGCESELRGAEVTKGSVVLDGKIITSRGIGTTFEFALKIVEIFQGIEKVAILKEQMVIA